MNEQNNKVYVVQDQHWVDKNTHKYVRKYDLTDAEKYGDIVYILDDKDTPLGDGLSRCIDKIKDRMFYQPGDYIVTIGNPVLIGLVMTIALDENDGEAQVLQWNKRADEYDVVNLKGVFDE